MYNLDISDQAQVALQLRVSHSDFVYRFLAGPPLRGGEHFTGTRTPFGRPWACEGILDCFENDCRWQRLLWTLACVLTVKVTMQVCRTQPPAPTACNWCTQRCAAVHRLHQGSLYCNMSHGTSVNVISFTPVTKVRPSLYRFSLNP